MRLDQIVSQSILSENFETTAYSGKKVEIVLPFFVEHSHYYILDKGEVYSPFPYVVAVYEHYCFDQEMNRYIYKLKGVEIK